MKIVISCVFLYSKLNFSFQPCDECIIGVLESLPVAKNFSLKQLYDQAVQWTVKFQDRIWVLRQFAKLQQDIIDDCVKRAESEIVKKPATSLQN